MHYFSMQLFQESPCSLHPPCLVRITIVYFVALQPNSFGFFFSRLTSICSCLFFVLPPPL